MVPTHDRWYKLISGVTNFETTSGVKPHHLLELRKAWAPIIWTHLVAPYDQTGNKRGCNSYASYIKGNPSTTKGKIDLFEKIYSSITAHYKKANKANQF
jgi:hypothetical protein